MRDKIYRVYSYKLMRYLESLGFIVIGTKQFQEDASKTIWMYEKSDDLLEAISFYDKMKK